MGQIVNTADSILKQAGNCIRNNPHILVEVGLAGMVLALLEYNVQAGKEHEKRDKLVEEQLKKNQAVIQILFSDAQKVGELEKINEFLMDALTQLSLNAAQA